MADSIANKERQNESVHFGREFPSSFKGGKIWDGEDFIRVVDFDYLANLPCNAEEEHELQERLKRCWDLINAVTLLGESNIAWVVFI
ncbi:MAG TPA: hypothetical protein PLL26_00665 [Candidatus Dojkabacteria bacterium]|mgnify:FL=1|nr:hypothetical protein [Candidatus Dojkabacteria bacterium]